MPNMSNFPTSNILKALMVTEAIEYRDKPMLYTLNRAKQYFVPFEILMKALRNTASCLDVFICSGHVIPNSCNLFQVVYSFQFSRNSLPQRLLNSSIS